MLGRLFCLTLLVALVFAQGPQCSGNNTRLDCKQFSQSQCVAAGCCWSPVNPNPNNLPWCFYRNSGSGAVCNPNTDVNNLIDCGYSGITQQQCLNQNCCWNEVNPNPTNIPYCYQSNPIVQGYNITSTSQTATGLLVDLEVADPENQFWYGSPISTLAVSVDYETNTRIHVKIYDPNNARWEVPQSVIPRPPATSKAPSPQYSFSSTSAPFGFAVTRNADNQVLFNTTVPSTATWNGLQFKDQFLSISTQLPSGASLYGLQEQTESSGLRLIQKTFTLWNRDTAAAASNTNLYGAHPFYMEVTSSGNAHGVLLLNSNGMDVIYESDHLTYKTIGGVLDFYIFVGPTPDLVVEQYNTLLGMPTMQPYWAFGFHQSRYGMPNLQYVEEVVQNYTLANIPLDTIWSDIDYMDVYKDFTWDPVNYPLDQVQSFISELHSQHQQYVIILDPGIKYNDTTYDSYNELLASGGYVRDASGNPFVGQVWPGYTIFPDFFNPAGQSFWNEQLVTLLTTVPYDGLWIDMNEISNFCSGECLNGAPVPPSSTTCGCSDQDIAFFYYRNNVDEHGNYLVLGDGSPSSTFDPVNPPYAIDNDETYDALNTKTLDMNAIHYNNTLEYDVHNLFSLTEAIQTSTSLEQFYNKRSFVLSRSTFPSSGHWTAHWTGDNASQWPDLYWSILGMLNFNILGVPMIGSDICGFLDATTEELCSRWIEVGAFYPFSRNHDTIGVPPQELYRWPQVAAISSFILRVRYSLLPLYYTLNYVSSTQGTAMARPLFFQFPQDSNTYSLDTQFLIGNSIMVAPVLNQGATTVNVYFPAAVWYNYYTYAQLSTPTASTTQTVSAPIDFVPVYFLGGSITPRHTNPQLTTYDTRMNSFNLTVAFDQNMQARGSLFVDDGETLNYQSASTYVQFSANVTGGKGTLSSSVVQNNYTNGVFNTSISAIIVLGGSSPTTVTVNNQQWTQFTYTNNVLTINGLSLQIGSAFQINWA